MHGYKWPINCTRTRTASDDDMDSDHWHQQKGEEWGETEEWLAGQITAADLAWDLATSSGDVAASEAALVRAEILRAASIAVDRAVSPAPSSEDGELC